MLYLWERAGEGRALSRKTGEGKGGGGKTAHKRPAHPKPVIASVCEANQPFLLGRSNTVLRTQPPVMRGLDWRIHVWDVKR